MSASVSPEPRTGPGTEQALSRAEGEEEGEEGRGGAGGPKRGGEGGKEKEEGR